MTPISRYVTAAGREIHLVEWNPQAAETVVMWHGLARTGRDFDPLARALCERYRVLCPDMLGRGLSQWATDAEAEYCLDFYARVAADLCAALGVERMRWVGTSMGGALGIRLAAGDFAGRFTHLVVNDIGPEVPQPAIDRILAYAGDPPDFATMIELEKFLRLVYTPFGYLPDAQWRQMAETSVRRRDDGRLTVHYDPRIVLQFRHHPHDYDQWEAWQRIACPALVLRGAESDLLLADAAERMIQSGPPARLEVIAGCGHAPALNVSEQIDLVRGFLESAAPPLVANTT